MVDENVNGKWLEKWQSGESGVGKVTDGAAGDLVGAMGEKNKRSGEEIEEILSREKFKKVLSMLSELKWLPPDYYFKDIDSMMRLMTNHIDPWSWESFKSAFKNIPEDLNYINIVDNEQTAVIKKLWWEIIWESATWFEAKVNWKHVIVEWWKDWYFDYYTAKNDQIELKGSESLKDDYDHSIVDANWEEVIKVKKGVIVKNIWDWEFVLKVAGK